MPSVIDICNGALRRLGQQPITSLDDPLEAARVAKDRYAPTRDMLLQAHSWNFAIRRAGLAAETAPAADGRRAFPLPTDCLAVLCVSAAYWSVEGRSILADASPPLAIVYGARIGDPGLYPPLFVEALSSRLAVEMAEPLTQSGSMAEAKMREHRQIMAEARTRDAQESGLMAFGDGAWAIARQGGTAWR